MGHERKIKKVSVIFLRAFSGETAVNIVCWLKGGHDNICVNI